MDEKLKSLLDAALKQFCDNPRLGATVELGDFRLTWADTDTLHILRLDTGRLDVWKRLRSVNKVS